MATVLIYYGCSDTRCYVRAARWPGSSTGACTRRRTAETPAAASISVSRSFARTRRFAAEITAVGSVRDPPVVLIKKAAGFHRSRQIAKKAGLIPAPRNHEGRPLWRRPCMT